MPKSEQYLQSWKVVEGETPVWSPDRNLARFNVRILTKELAEKLGHIAWIEEADPVIALRKMADALQTPPCNCAVWANAAQGEDPQWRKDLAQWRTDDRFAFLSSFDGGKGGNYFKVRFSTAASALSDLRLHFAAAANPPPQLERHMQMRLKDMFNALPKGLGVRFQLRDNETLDYTAPHTDGSSGEDMQLRFLECLHGPGTYLFSNADTITQLDAFQQKDPTLTMPREGSFDVYEAPAGSMILLSNTKLGWQPILHSEPFLPDSVPPRKRTVTTYDFSRKKR